MLNFAGRKEELLHIEGFCSDNQSNLLYLSGDDGIGKSRLVNEFARKMSDKHWIFIFKPAQHESPNNYGYQWLKDFLTGDTFFNGRDAWIQEMEDEVKIKDFIKLALSFDNASMEFRIVELFERISSLLKNDQKLFIVIDPEDDLDGDKNINFFRYLSEKIHKKTKIILSQKNRAVLESIKRESVDVLDLTAISENETRKIILKSSIFNETRPDLVQKLVDNANGNPLYINFAIKQLEQVTVNEQVDESEINNLPDNTNDLLLTFYNSIHDKDCLEILRWLSIIPGTVDNDILSFLTLFPLEKIKECLEKSEIKLFFEIKENILSDDSTKLEIKPLHKTFVNILRHKSFPSEQELDNGYKKLSAYYLKKTLDDKENFASLANYHLSLYLSRDKEAYIKSANGLVEKFYTFMLRDSCIEIIKRTIDYCHSMKMEQEVYVDFINQAGIICHEQRHIDDALDFLNQAIAIYKKANNREGEASALGNIGIVYRDIFKTNKAFEFLQASLDIYTEIKDLNGQANILTQMWKIDYEMSNFDRAIGYLLKLMIITKQTGSNEKLSSVLGNIGNLYCGSGDFDKAVIYYEQALHIVESLGDAQKTAIYLSRIGISYLYNSLQYEALEYFSNSLKLYQNLGNIQGEATQYGNIGIAYKNIGDLENSLMYFKYALKLFTRRVSLKHIKLMKQNIDTVQKLIKKKEDLNE